MEDQETVPPIEHLPIEVMCNIFDYLDIDAVKQCSLVCRRWKEIIFSDHYIQRFKFSYGYLDSFKPNFVQTDRLYRHVKLCLETKEFSVMYGILSYPCVKQYITLELENLAPENLKMITDAVEQMTVLREICITNCSWKKIHYNIRSRSLQSLRLENTLPIFINTPNLTTFITKIEFNVTVARLFSYRFPNLKHLEIDSKPLLQKKDVEHAIRFFAHLKGLETLILRGASVYGFAFKAICENCTNLEKLHIQNMCFINGSMINRLSKLTKLGELTLVNIDCINPVSFSNVNLPQLKTLGMGNFRMQHETLKAFRSATKLKLFHDEYPRAFISTVVKKMPLVREIECMNTFNSHLLVQFPSVEVIVFHKDRLDLLFYMFPLPMSNIKEIYCLSSYMKPTDATIAGLLTLFPNLQLLKTEESCVYRSV